MTATARPAGPPTSSIHVSSSGIGRRGDDAAAQLSDWLRRGSGPLLARRRRMVAAALASAASMGVVALYQTGIVKHLPDPPGFDSDRVDASAEAYVAGHVPDALLGLVSYGVTAVLAAMGGADRNRRSPWLPLALALKVAADAGGAAFLTAEQLTRHRKLCAWCLAAAIATGLMLPDAVAEARDALPNIRRG